MSEQEKSLPQRIREADLEDLNDGELLEEAACALESAAARVAALESALKPFAGLLGRVEAWSKATGNPIPGDDHYSPELLIAMDCLRIAHAVMKGARS